MQRLKQVSAYCCCQLLLMLGSVVCTDGAEIDSIRKKTVLKRSSHRIDAAPLCSPEEYFDFNVHSCSRCSEICRPNIDLTLCIIKCPEFFHQAHNSSIHLTSFFTSATRSISLEVEAQEERLVDKPLFWTSVVSMTIAVAATVAIIVLCTRRKKRSATSSVRSTAELMSSVESSRHPSDSNQPIETKRLLHIDKVSNEGGSGGYRRESGNDRQHPGAGDPENGYACMTDGGLSDDCRNEPDCRRNWNPSDFPSTPVPEQDRKDKYILLDEKTLPLSAKILNDQSSSSNTWEIEDKSREMRLKPTGSRDFSSALPLSSSLTTPLSDEQTRVKLLAFDQHHETIVETNKEFPLETLLQQEPYPYRELKLKDVGIWPSKGTSVAEIDHLMMQFENRSTRDSTSSSTSSSWNQNLKGRLSTVVDDVGIASMEETNKSE